MNRSNTARPVRRDHEQRIIRTPPMEDGMGAKDAQEQADTAAAMETFFDDLSSLIDVTSKKMFGGYGIFSDGVMFALVDPSGRRFLRADESTVGDFESADSDKHRGMPYWTVPDVVAADDAEFERWARRAAEVAHAAKKR
jgi:DNA transformation protein